MKITDICRSLQWPQERWTGIWVNSGLGNKSRKITPRAQGSPPPESLLWKNSKLALWNIPFWPQDVLHITFKTLKYYPSMCWPPRKRKHSIHLYIPRDCIESACTHLLCVFSVAGAGRMSPVWNLCGINTCGTPSGDVHQKTMGHTYLAVKERGSKLEVQILEIKTEIALEVFASQ